MQITWLVLATSVEYEISKDEYILWYWLGYYLHTYILPSAVM